MAVYIYIYIYIYTNKAKNTQHTRTPTLIHTQTKPEKNSLLLLACALEWSYARAMSWRSPQTSKGAEHPPWVPPFSWVPLPAAVERFPRRA